MTETPPANSDQNRFLLATCSSFDHERTIRPNPQEIESAGVVTTLTASGAFTDPWGVAVDVSGNLYVADTDRNLIRKVTPSGVVTTVAGAASSGSADGTGSAARFYAPSGVAVDRSGKVYVADTGNQVIRKIT